MIDLRFTNFDRLLVQSFKVGENNSARYYFFMPLVEIKDFDVLIGNKSFF